MWVADQTALIVFVDTVVQNYCLEFSKLWKLAPGKSARLASVNCSFQGATGYIGWNGLPTGNNYTSELWAANRSSRAAANVYPQQMQIGGPISHNSFQRSFSSPTHRQYCSVPWIFIQLHNIVSFSAFIRTILTQFFLRLILFSFCFQCAFCGFSS